MRAWYCVLVCGVWGAYAVEQIPAGAPAPEIKIITAQPATPLSKNEPNRDPFAASEPIKTATAPIVINELILHGVAIADKPYALISYGNKLFSVTNKERVNEWIVQDIAFDYVMLKSEDGTSKQLMLEQRINDEGAQ